MKKFKVRTTGVAGGLICPIRALLTAPLKGIKFDPHLIDCFRGTMIIFSTSYWHWLLATLKRVTQITIVLVFDRVVDFLILDIFPDLGFIQANGTHIITPSPKTMSLKVLFQTAIFLAMETRDSARFFHLINSLDNLGSND